MLPVLVVVPCGQQKIWQKKPEAGPTAAQDAYTGTPFIVNRRYAERFGDRWVILSAKYGLIAPDVMLPGPYEVTFKQRSTHPVTLDTLRAQAAALPAFGTVIGLGGKAYRTALEDAFSMTDSQLLFPFAGLSLGYALQATKQAVTTGTPLP